MCTEPAGGMCVFGCVCTWDGEAGCWCVCVPSLPVFVETLCLSLLKAQFHGRGRWPAGTLSVTSTAFTDPISCFTNITICSKPTTPYHAWLLIGLSL